MKNEINGKELEKSVNVVKDVSTSIVVTWFRGSSFLSGAYISRVFHPKRVMHATSREDYHQAVMYFSQAIRLDAQNSDSTICDGVDVRYRPRIDLQRLYRGHEVV